MSTRDVIRKLARSPIVTRATHAVAEQLGARAKQIDPDGQFVVEDGVIDVAGLIRNDTTVTNVAPDAAKKEFGGAKQAAYRPLGRAARYVRR